MSVKITMVATNTEQIQITGGIFMELMAKDVQCKRHKANVMVYISTNITLTSFIFEEMPA